MSDPKPGGLNKRSVMIAGHRTSVSLEPEFWEALREVAAKRGQSVQALVAAIDTDRGARNLSSAIRVFVLGALRAHGPEDDGSHPGHRFERDRREAVRRPD